MERPTRQAWSVPSAESPWPESARTPEARADRAALTAAVRTMQNGSSMTEQPTPDARLLADLHAATKDTGPEILLGLCCLAADALAAAGAPPEPVRPDPDEALPKGVERLNDGGFVCRGSVLPTIADEWQRAEHGPEGEIVGWQDLDEHSGTGCPFGLYEVRHYWRAAAVSGAPEDATGDGEA